ncbi:helix-turn-helix domain-containing protein [Oricola sp.]|uniref:helix-turn-helix domain-containing protein n=1 Tax=Oricola sp. TaxID=1979950 RepID=UPI002600AC54|nr:helix-turn-helix domain-containing protein [Oricola sp.]MCI5076968.1 helix-turn-helix domain-containing protein [Oricola sp.]
MTKLANRSLDRGISILESLARNGASSLADLHRDCDLAKSTIRRLLATLISHRLVRRSVSDGLYRVTITLPAGAGEPIPQDMANLIDVAMPRAVELTKRVEWPSDVHVLDGPCMRIIDSTRPLSPFHMYRGIINRRINMFGSATGMACLAWRSDEEIAEYDHLTLGNISLGLARFGMKLAQYMPDIEKTRARGYGTRLGVYRGETVLDDGLAAIAIPIMVAGEPQAAISLLWPRAFQEPKDFAKRFLEPLQETAELITTDMTRLFPAGQTGQRAL